MPTLSGQRASFTWCLNQYNLAEDNAAKQLNAKRMAKVLQRAPSLGLTIDEITQKQLYPEAEIAKFLGDTPAELGPDVVESQAIEAVHQAVDTSDLTKVGEGAGAVYAYGYRCAPDRLKIGLTSGDTVGRVMAQISTGTPDKPTLYLEIRTHDWVALERAIHATLDYRGKRVIGAGKEWFKTTREEVLGIYATMAE